MEAKAKQAANEIKRLRVCINNLISVQGLDRLSYPIAAKK
jgi:hypothetical protein